MRHKFNYWYYRAIIHAGRAIGGAAVCAMLTGGAAYATDENVVNVYSYRQAHLVEPLFARFTEETGISVQTIFAKKGLIERVKAEGPNSPADILLTTDISRLEQAVAAGISQPLNSEKIRASIPEAYRDASAEWFALTLRARVIYASKDRVDQDEITYEELADEKWRGKICTRSGQHDYSLGLVSSMVNHLGVERAKAWLAGVRDNLAHKPSGNDRSQVKSIYAGQCDIALGNTYYMGLMQTNDKDMEQRDWAEAVKLIFPNKDGRGTHVNVSGMILAKYAPHRESAVKLMEFLVGEEAQRMYAEVNHEYPVRAGVAVADRVRQWGDLHADKLPMAAISEKRMRASQLVDEVYFDDGPQ